MFHHDTIPEKYGEKIADILVRAAGCKSLGTDSMWHRVERAGFVSYYASGGSEYRFQGSLGFGGKFWNYGGDRGWKSTATARTSPQNAPRSSQP